MRIGAGKQEKTASLKGRLRVVQGSRFNVEKSKIITSASLAVSGFTQDDACRCVEVLKCRVADPSSSTGLILIVAYFTSTDTIKLVFGNSSRPFVNRERKYRFFVKNTHFKLFSRD